MDLVPCHLPAFPEETALDEEIPVLPEGIVPGIARVGFHQGDPGQRIIAADAGEILPEARRPVLVPCLVAVDQDVREGLSEVWTQVFLQRTQHLVPVILGHVPVHLVRLQGLADEFVRERMRVGQRGCVTDPEDGPASLGSIPDQISVGIHPVRQVDHFIRGSIGLDRDRHDGNVPVESGLASRIAPATIHRGLRLRQDGFDGSAAFDGRPAVHDLLHALLLVDPRPAGRTVSRRIVQADLQSQFLRNLGRISQGFPIGIAPVRLLRPGIVLHRMVRLLHRRGDVENRRSADAGLLHRLQILPDAFLGKVGAHPVPPDIRTVLHGRSSEHPGKVRRRRDFFSPGAGAQRCQEKDYETGLFHFANTSIGFPRQLWGTSRLRISATVAAMSYWMTVSWISWFFFTPLPQMTIGVSISSMVVPPCPVW